MPAESVPIEPWRSFLADLDGLLKAPVELRCLGGFVVTQQYGIGRETSDIDFLAAIKQSPEDDVEGLAGLGSKLHRKYRLYMQHVTIATPPAEYVVGAVCLVLAVILFLPMPLGDILPALAISLAAFGILKRDGAWVIAGLIFAVVAIIVVGGAIVAATLAFLLLLRQFMP